MRARSGKDNVNALQIVVRLIEKVGELSRHLVASELPVMLSHAINEMEIDSQC